jgi:hypothetical protein
MDDVSYCDDVGFQLVHRFLDGLGATDRTVAVKYLEGLHQRGDAGGASSTDPFIAPVFPPAVVPIGRVECHWQWLYTAVLVADGLQRVEIWANTSIYLEASSVDGRRRRALRCIDCSDHETVAAIASSMIEYMADIEDAAERVESLELSRQLYADVLVASVALSVFHPSVVLPVTPAGPVCVGMTARDVLSEIRACVLSASGATMRVYPEAERYLAGLRAAAQAYDMVRVKASHPGSLSHALAARIGAARSVKALACTLRDAVVKRAVCVQGGFASEESFVAVVDDAFGGVLRRDEELGSQILNSYHHVAILSDDKFRSKCSKKSYRARRGNRGGGQVGGGDGCASRFCASASVHEPYFPPDLFVSGVADSWRSDPYEFLPSVSYQHFDISWGSLPMPMRMTPAYLWFA